MTAAADTPSPVVPPPTSDEHAPRDRALSALRAMTRGPKGNRPDYIGSLSTADATVLLDLLDRALPVYDAHAFGSDELRYLRIYRTLGDEGRKQADAFLQYLVETHNV